MQCINDDYLIKYSNCLQFVDCMKSHGITIFCFGKTKDLIGHKDLIIQLDDHRSISSTYNKTTDIKLSSAHIKHILLVDLTEVTHSCTSS